MNCLDFERVLPDYLESAHTSEQQRTEFVSRLCWVVGGPSISFPRSAAVAGTEDPSPAVWNSLELQLQREGLIRDNPIRGDRSRTIHFPAGIFPQTEGGVVSTRGGSSGHCGGSEAVPAAGCGRYDNPVAGGVTPAAAALRSRAKMKEC